MANQMNTLFDFSDPQVCADYDAGLKMGEDPQASPPEGASSAFLVGFNTAEFGRDLDDNTLIVVQEALWAAAEELARHIPEEERSAVSGADVSRVHDRLWGEAKWRTFAC